MLTGENGIINQAKNAKEESLKSELEELVDLTLMEYKTDKAVGKDTDLGELLNSKVGKDFDAVTEEEDYYIVEKNGYEVKVSKDGERLTDAEKVGGVRPKLEISKNYDEAANKVIITVKITNIEELETISKFELFNESNNKLKEKTSERNLKTYEIIEDGKYYAVVEAITNKITKTGNASIEIDEFSKLIGTEETSPYFPSEDCTIIEKKPEKGITVKDQNENEWVWIEVPKSITKNANTDKEIEKALIAYVNSYRKSGWEDTYQEGLGMDQNTYENNYNKMLQSIKKYGGFWIGRYEMGMNIIRTSSTEPITEKALSQQNKYPYNYITVAQAQKLSEGMNPDKNQNITSLMYGLQWDLMCKYIEVKKSKTEYEIQTDSVNWGNYMDSTFDITRGKYSTNYGETYTTVDKIYTKKGGIVLTTGATERNMVLNIYDIAGNLSEWTLEKNATDESNSYVALRGGYINSGTGYLAQHGSNPASASYNTFSARPTIFKK